VAAVVPWAASRASDEVGPCRHRPLPENARVRPGIDTQGYPHLDGLQKWAVGREVVGSSVRALIDRPLGSVGQVVGRSAERLAVHGREMTAWAGSAAASDPFGTPGDGCLDAPFGSPSMPARLTLLPSSESAVNGLLALAASATRRLDLMIYGWEDDPTGREVASALAAAAGRGVRVRLLVDRAAFLMHNRAAAEGRRTFLDHLAARPNVTLIQPPDPFLRFDHRKLAIADGRTAWSGGMILTEVARRKWSNLAFLAEGPVAAQYAAVFEDRWRDVGGAPEPPVAVAPDATQADFANANVRLVRTDLRDRSLKDTLYHAIDHARDHVYLENPYFSDTLLAEKLVEARRRGVDVRAVLTLRGNVRKLNRYVVLTANRLLRGGVRVYLAPDMTHVKALSVDGAWCYLGTGNFDELSLRNNREVGLAVSGSAVTRALDESIFLPDMTRAQELTDRLPTPEHWLWLKVFSLWF
jgi:cardiolipin synthase